MQQRFSEQDFTIVQIVYTANSFLVERWERSRYLVIKQCNYTNLLQTLLPVWIERKLTTFVYTLNCPQPLRFRLTKKFEFTTFTQT
ncbi:unnamed protein product [Caenorhabditis brenneri]